MKNVIAFIRQHPYWVTTALIWIAGVLFLLIKFPALSQELLIFTALILLPPALYIITHALLKSPIKPETPLPCNATVQGSISLLKELEEIKQQLLIQDKMASVGMLTGGIAHEIKNPLNFVNNFSEMASGLLVELKEEFDKCEIPQTEKDNIKEILKDLQENLNSIHQHGKRAESIVKHILMQAHTEELTKVDTNINELLDEYLHLAYHGMRAQNPEFNVSLKTNYAPNPPLIQVAQQNVGRVFLNIINNGLYAAYDRKQLEASEFMPTIEVKTEALERGIKISIKDNGLGIPDSIKQKIFEPFFTTKPIGVGTGLGLHICHDIIVKQHAGQIEVDSKKGEYTEFIIILPFQTGQTQ
ncbi:MAG: HAMP domain-containing sensor histidine kinase [Gammaproteobacteria bacterium]